MRWTTLAFYLSLCTSAYAAECQTEFKPTDTYKELSAALKCLNDQVVELRKVVKPHGPSTLAPPAAPTNAAQESGGVRIEIEKCSKSGGAIDCKIFVTALDKDQHVSMSGNDFVVDENGVSYKWRGFQKIGEKSMEGGSNQRLYIAGVRTAAVLSFAAETESPATVLRAIQLTIAPEAGQFRPLTFRNVSLL